MHIYILNFGNKVIPEGNRVSMINYKYGPPPQRKSGLKHYAITRLAALFVYGLMFDFGNLQEQYRAKYDAKCPQ